MGFKTGIFSFEAPDSICPKGWRMVGDEGEKSFENLFAEYYGGTYPIPYPGIDGSNADTIALVSNFTFLRSGGYSWNSGVLDHSASGGCYWSVKASSSMGARILYFSYMWLNYQVGDRKGYGFSLRCVAR